MLRVGLTGGIGSGKSAVAQRLAALGAVVIDGDTAARAVVEPGTPGLAQIAETFGPDVLRPDGTLDRAKLAGIVFTDEAARQKLNAITHPLILAHILAQEQAAREQAAREQAARGEGGQDTIVVHDVPLLAEGQRAADFDVVVVVDVPAELQVTRLAGRGLPEDQARARMAAQATREQRLAIAGIVIDNSGTPADLDRRVAEVWADLTARARQRSA
ncbi:MAG TPA: dephospho-CoA kinase [Trebonia sp.]|nr:dephospho-CoA kinase [Trebonia sp.]